MNFYDFHKAPARPDPIKRKGQGRRQPSALVRLAAWAWQGPRWRVVLLASAGALPVVVLFVAAFRYFIL